MTNRPDKYWWYAPGCGSPLGLNYITDSGGGALETLTQLSDYGTLLDSIPALDETTGWWFPTLQALFEDISTRVSAVARRAPYYAPTVEHH